jgi:transposase
MKRIYVGIDWADDHHDVYVTDDTAKMLDSFSIAHSFEGMEKLRTKLSKVSDNPEDILVAIESHHGLLIYSLLEAGYAIYPINPKSMDRYRDRYRMSSSKSDPRDAMVLANILRTDLHLYKPLPKERAEDARLRQLTRTHKSFVQQKVKLVNQLTDQLKSYFPAALRLFSGLDHEITLAFLERYPTPKMASLATEKEIYDFFREQGYSHYKRASQVYKVLQEPALECPEEMIDVYRIVVLSLVPVLRSLIVQVAKLAKEISKEFKRNPAYRVFRSLPTGELTTARLNAELGSSGARYPSRDYVQTAAGTAPVTRRSGKTIIVYFRLQCNKNLRIAFTDLARESVRRCSWASDYFSNQLKHGHKPARAYRALANRWASIIWRMLQEMQPFDQSRIAGGSKNATTSLLPLNAPTNNSFIGA